MNLNKLRIMQQIQFDLTAVGLSVDIINTGKWFVLQVFTHNERKKLVLLECVDSMSITESELQLWHDTIVYGPQVKEGE